MALTRDGRHLAAALTDRTVPLLRVTQKELKEGKSLVGHEGAVVSLDWSMESRWLLSASDDNTVRIWDPSKGEYAMMFANSQHNFKTQRERDPPNTPLKVQLARIINTTVNTPLTPFPPFPTSRRMFGARNSTTWTSLCWLRPAAS